MKTYRIALQSLQALSLLLSAVPALAITIETVPVGNPGNAGEWTGDSYGGWGPDHVCGAVAYAYNIGKYEVTAGQYCAFLNAVAATDAYGLYNTEMWSFSGGCKIQRSGSLGRLLLQRGRRLGKPPGELRFLRRRMRFANWLHNGQPSGMQNLSTTEDGAYRLNGRHN